MQTTKQPIVATRLRIAYRAASLSEEATQVGAFLIAKDRNEITSWNYTCDGELHHAEQSAIEAAADLGIDIYGGTMYAPWHACLPCAEMIVQAGIRRVYGHLPVKHASELRTPKWTETVNEGIALLVASGVESIWYVDPLPATVITIQGEPYDPGGPPIGDFGAG